ncbi:MarR family transcriptional regulator [uncultured Clostridium sp.]|jgi:DNA-binding MarR family transcriptional regulator|uniref:MarR family winged helix-turn-helix transcriptional regulator n=1 Tax=uncultured Clostridium sp. TaxID=59620 RepID=UPI0026299998|nr:MarR family transcriptional regulator [uncultured Clostridium sp.]
MDILTALGVIRERINKTLKDELKNSSVDINCNHMWLLSIVYFNNDKIEIKELVRSLEKKKSTVTEIINTLEKNDLLIKSQSSDDKRIYYVETTQKANDLKPQILNIIEEIQKKVFEGFSKEESAILSKLILRVVDNLN